MKTATVPSERNNGRDNAAVAGPGAVVVILTLQSPASSKLERAYLHPREKIPAEQ
jgi:hypothetical protein